MKDKDVADTFNEYFGSIVESLDLYKWESETSDLGLNDSNQHYLDIIIAGMKNIQVYKWYKILEFLKSLSSQLVSKDEIKNNKE